MTRDVDAYFTEGCGRCQFGGTPQCKVHTWTNEMKYLRIILQSSVLKEEIKWGVPCYTYRGKNVVLLSAFKSFCSVNFLKGALLKDELNILKKPGDNSRAARIMKFENTQQVLKSELVLKAYLAEAIEIEKSGKTVNLKTNNELEYPEELKQMLKQNPILDTAFGHLTPGRKRGYVIFINQAKQPKTRISRIEKCIPKILEGKGWNEQ